MIWAAITIMARWLTDLPRWIKLVGVGALITLALMTLHQCAVDRAIDAERARSGAMALGAARKADEAAGITVTAVQSKIAKGNEDARKAAVGSNDPLKSGLDSLRAGKAADSPSAR